MTLTAKTAEQLRVRDPSLVKNQQFLRKAILRYKPICSSIRTSSSDWTVIRNAAMRQENRFTTTTKRDARNRDFDNGVRKDNDNRNDGARASSNRRDSCR